MRKNEAGQADGFKPGLVMRRVRIDAASAHFSTAHRDACGPGPPIGTEGSACRHQWRQDAFAGYLMLGDEDMPATSKAQQKAAGAALAAKRGDQPKSKLRGASKQMEESMTEKQLEEFASTKRKKLPARKS